MTAGDLSRKGIQVQTDVYKRLTDLKGEMTKKFAKTAHPRDATFDDVLADVLGIKR